MIIKQAPDLTENDTTAYALYQNRREFLKLLGGATVLGTVLPSIAWAKSVFSTDETPTDFDDITTYNNFYEFGTAKGDPAINAKSLITSPWSVTVDGECEKPGHYTLEDILKTETIEERIYRMRCVEGWSMVIPWQGFALADLLKRFQPTSKAKFVRFQTLADPKQMPKLKQKVLSWPYTEGLRMDEAMHPLTLIATGLYDKPLLNQNGAPLRLVVPWKYGFKSIKSIVRISFVEQQPISSWERLSAEEYGFYSNVNPNVDHPRWSQYNERRIGEFRKRKTLMFNGYEEQVASLYSGMDLRKYY
ncbi:protein-methionine-sulfoxide reductase catalytic subunit MsrP [uncultured Thiothrix sp.]|uniref:protein-methionine-sulfoxide reductase catalytic subunit MsrP n=1 Tax=uncultured Thiothrix sp. TaxID=223185 RepID=UPI00261E8F22|nr:protein-methionine-sulfoxide reductase catalytic subunit MsrP [uncultured Thiothrix sp.]